MALERPDVVDLMTFDGARGEWVLAIRDDWPWTDAPRHCAALEEKINAYLRVAGERKARIHVFAEHLPDEAGCAFVHGVQVALREAGLVLNWHWAGSQPS